MVDPEEIVILSLSNGDIYKVYTRFIYTSNKVPFGTFRKLYKQGGITEMDYLNEIKIRLPSPRLMCGVPPKDIVLFSFVDDECRRMYENYLRRNFIPFDAVIDADLVRFKYLDEIRLRLEIGEYEDLPPEGTVAMSFVNDSNRRLYTRRVTECPRIAPFYSVINCYSLKNITEDQFNVEKQFRLNQDDLFLVLDMEGYGGEEWLFDHGFKYYNYMFTRGTNLLRCEESEFKSVKSNYIDGRHVFINRMIERGRYSFVSLKNFKNITYTIYNNLETIETCTPEGEKNGWYYDMTDLHFSASLYQNGIKKIYFTTYPFYVLDLYDQNISYDWDDDRNCRVSIYRDMKPRGIRTAPDKVFRYTISNDGYILTQINMGDIEVHYTDTGVIYKREDTEICQQGGNISQLAKRTLDESLVINYTPNEIQMTYSHGPWYIKYIESDIYFYLRAYYWGKGVILCSDLNLTFRLISGNSNRCIKIFPENSSYMINTEDVDIKVIFDDINEVEKSYIVDKIIFYLPGEDIIFKRENNFLCKSEVDWENKERAIFKSFDFEKLKKDSAEKYPVIDSELANEAYHRRRFELEREKFVGLI